MKKQNKSKDDRREQILTAAFDMAVAEGYDSLTRDAIAEKAGVASGQINWIFENVDNLRGEVLSRVIDVLISTKKQPLMDDAPKLYLVVAKGLASCHDVARSAPIKIKSEAIKLLV